MIIKKFRYNPLRTSFELSGITLNNKDTRLLTIANLKVDVDALKTIQLKPTITSLYIDAPDTFIEKRGKYDFVVPEYLETKKNSSGLKIPISLEEIVLINGRLSLREKGASTDILKDLNVRLAGINTSSPEEIKPIISGKFFDKNFNIKGITTIKEDSLINQFDIMLNKFNIAQIADYIPDIQNLKIKSGIITANAKVSFITFKNRKPRLLLKGSAEVKKLNINDNKTGVPILTNVNGSVLINDYNIFGDNLDMASIKVTSGALTLRISDIEKERSSIFDKPPGKNKFVFKLDDLQIKGTEIVIDDRINGERIPVTINSLSLQNLSTDKDINSAFVMNLDSRNICENIRCDGFFNVTKKTISLNSVSVENFLPLKIAFLKTKSANLENVEIRKFSGNFDYSPDKFVIKGSGDFFNINYLIGKNKIVIDKISVDSGDIDIKNSIYSFKKLNTTGLSFISAIFALNNLNFTIKENKITLKNDSKNNRTKIEFQNAFGIDDIKGEYVEKEKACFYLKALELNQNATVNLDKVVDIRTDGKIYFKDLSLFHNDKAIMKIESFDCALHNFSLNPVRLNINSIALNSPFFTVDIKNDKKLYLFSLQNIDFTKKGESLDLNIDFVKVFNGKILYTDYSLNSPMSLTLSAISGEIKNLPSFVYPEGSIDISGVINNRNSFYFATTIGANYLNGTLKSGDLVLPSFDPYLNYYLGYNILSGSAEISSSFHLKENDFDAIFDADFTNFKIKKTAPASGADLSKIIPLLEDEQNKFSLSIPVKGKWNEPSIDFRKMFFNIFYDIINRSNKTFTGSITDKFIKDGSYEIVNFIPGTDKTLLDADDIFSEEIKTKFTNPKYSFYVEGYLDKQADMPYIKEEMLKEKIFNYTATLPAKGSEEETSIIKRIYMETAKKEPPADINAEDMRKELLKLFQPTESDYLNLTYKRLNKIKEILTTKYAVNENRIFFSEKNIFENPYVAGIGNSLGIVLSGAIDKSK
ncbi:MAG TPA: DUF748 domain-containing protein [Spirochaetota bacterium]|nr:DUF748 domain-containing protein [Spirochaetota bacterium]